MKFSKQKDNAYKDVVIANLKAEIRHLKFLNASGDKRIDELIEENDKLKAKLKPRECIVCGRPARGIEYYGQFCSYECEEKYHLRRD